MQQLLRDHGDSARYGLAPIAFPLSSSLLVKVPSLKANRYILRVEFCLCEAVEEPASMMRCRQADEAMVLAVELNAHLMPVFGQRAGKRSRSTPRDTRDRSAQ